MMICLTVLFFLPLIRGWVPNFFPYLSCEFFHFLLRQLDFSVFISIKGIRSRKNVVKKCTKADEPKNTHEILKFFFRIYLYIYFLVNTSPK